MKTETKKTAAILGTAGALVAAAILIDRGPALGGEPQPIPTRPKVVASAPLELATCGEDAPATSTANFAHGTLGAAMSAGKIWRADGGEVYAAFDVDTAAADVAQRPPLNLSLVIDRSGSMSGDKLAHAKQASLDLIGRLDGGDRVALVQYDDTAQVVVPSIEMDREGKERLRAAIARMTVGGSTNLHAGMRLGHDEVSRTFDDRQVRRIIVLSDGKANAGIVDPAQIADVARSAAARGVRITSVGVGLDYNEDLMESIAEAGRGNYHYVRDSAALESVMHGELRSIQGTVASSVELRLRTICDGVEIEDIVGYEHRRDGRDTVVAMSDLSGGDSRTVLVKLRVPDGQRGPIGALTAVLAYRDATTRQPVEVAVSLGVEVTDDRTAARESVNEDVMAQVLKAEAADSMRAAAHAYQGGDRDGALRILRSSSTRLEAKRHAYGVSAGAAAPAMSGLADMAVEAEESAPGTESAKALVKKNKAAARQMSKGK